MVLMLTTLWLTLSRTLRTESSSYFTVIIHLNFNSFCWGFVSPEKKWGYLWEMTLVKPLVFLAYCWCFLIGLPEFLLRLQASLFLLLQIENLVHILESLCLVHTNHFTSDWIIVGFGIIFHISRIYTFGILPIILIYFFEKDKNILKYSLNLQDLTSNAQIYPKIKQLWNFSYSANNLANYSFLVYYLVRVNCSAYLWMEKRRKGVVQIRFEILKFMFFNVKPHLRTNVWRKSTSLSYDDFLII